MMKFNFKKYLQLWKRIWIQWLVRPKGWRKQWRLELGVYYLRRGTPYQPGQAFQWKNAKGKWQQKKIKNLFFNFRQNKITHSFENQ